MGHRRATVLVVGIWLLGLVALGVVLQVERTVDQARRAQVVVAEMRNKQGAVISSAFSAAIGGGAQPATLAETRAPHPGGAGRA